MSVMTTFTAAHLRHIQAAGLSRETIKARGNVLRLADRQLAVGVNESTTDELVQWLATEHWSAQTRANYFGHITGYYRWAVQAEPGLDFDPSARLRRPAVPEGVPNPVTDDELATAIDGSDSWWRRIITLAAYAGLRAGEIVRLRREDVTAEHIRIWHGKGDRDAYVPTAPQIWQIVQPEPQGLLVTGQKLHRPVTRGRLSCMARAHFDALGMPEVHMHRFRHWFGTKLAENHVDMFTIQDLMRHRDPKTTRIYVQIAGEQRRLAISTLPTLDSRSSESPSVEDRVTPSQSWRVGRRARRGRITRP